jgi:hypothetical protein
VTDLLVEDDGVVVIEGERRRETVPVDGEADGDENKSQAPNPKPQIPTCRSVRVSLDLGFGI